MGLCGYMYYKRAHNELWLMACSSVYWFHVHGFHTYIHRSSEWEWDERWDSGKAGGDLPNKTNMTRHCALLVAAARWFRCNYHSRCVCWFMLIHDWNVFHLKIKGDARVLHFYSGCRATCSHGNPFDHSPHQRPHWKIPPFAKLLVALNFSDI